MKSNSKMFLRNADSLNIPGTALFFIWTHMSFHKVAATLSKVHTKKAIKTNNLELHSINKMKQKRI